MKKFSEQLNESQEEEIYNKILPLVKQVTGQQRIITGSTESFRKYYRLAIDTLKKEFPSFTDKQVFNAFHREKNQTAWDIADELTKIQLKKKV